MGLVFLRGRAQSKLDHAVKRDEIPCGGSPGAWTGHAFAVASCPIRHTRTGRLQGKQMLKSNV